ncbi:ricin B lectin domain-containing protein [Infundibulicybe gibba]|nr:ricin B lectin domain-containing protein [Infundibulicybe gibba]
MVTQLILSVLLSASGALARTYTFVNLCPQNATLFISGVQQGSLAANGGSSTQVLPQTFSGLVYTDANGGNGASGAGTTRAGFFGNNGDYYFVVDANHFNTGVRITPNTTAANGFCGEVVCDSPACSAFLQPPTAFPSPMTTPPPPPLSSCAGDISYTVTFCPSGAFPGTPPPPPPPSTGVVNLHPNGNTAKCLDVRGAVLANGTPVQIFDCNGTPAQNWVINSGPTSVALNGTGFCLDAGSTPGNNVGMKIWQCFNGLPAQSWFYTDDKRIALAGQGQCLDLTNGDLTNSNQVQTFKCTDGNTNQIWTE